MARIVHNPDRDVNERYLSQVSEWIAENGEVLVVIRYLCGGGAKDFALVRSKDEFDLLVDVCPDGADIIVFRQRQLPLRGEIDDEFIRLASKHIDGNEFMFVLTTPEKENDPRCFGSFDYASCLEEELKEWIGEQAAVGICPDFMVADHEDMISVSKGGIDGPR